MTKFKDDVLDEVRACITDKKNPTKCIDKVMDENDFDAEDKGEILTKLLKDE